MRECFLGLETRLVSRMEEIQGGACPYNCQSREPDSRARPLQNDVAGDLLSVSYCIHFH